MKRRQRSSAGRNKSTRSGKGREGKETMLYRRRRSRRRSYTRNMCRCAARAPVQLCYMPSCDQVIRRIQARAGAKEGEIKRRNERPTARAQLQLAMASLPALRQRPVVSGGATDNGCAVVHLVGGIPVVFDAGHDLEHVRAHLLCRPASARLG